MTKHQNLTLNKQELSTIIGGQIMSPFPDGGGGRWTISNLGGGGSVGSDFGYGNPPKRRRP